MDKRYCIVIAVLLMAAALLCGCTSTTQQGAIKNNTSSGQTVVTSTEGAQIGKLVEVDYIGTFENGSEFDSSKERGPFSLVLGSGNAIPGFEKALIGMKIGDSKKFSLSPDEAYGEYDPSRIISMPIDFIPTGENATIGQQVTLFNGGQYFAAKIVSINATNVSFDLNNPLAGKSLTFDVTVRNISEIPSELLSANVSK